MIEDIDINPQKKYQNRTKSQLILNMIAVTSRYCISPSHNMACSQNRSKGTTCGLDLLHISQLIFHTRIPRFWVGPEKKTKKKQTYKFKESSLLLLLLVLWSDLNYIDNYIYIYTYTYMCIPIYICMYWKQSHPDPSAELFTCTLRLFWCKSSHW